MNRKDAKNLIREKILEIKIKGVGPTRRIPKKFTVIEIINGNQTVVPTHLLASGPREALIEAYAAWLPAKRGITVALEQYKDLEKDFYNNGRIIYKRRQSLFIVVFGFLSPTEIDNEVAKATSGTGDTIQEIKPIGSRRTGRLYNDYTIISAVLTGDPKDPVGYYTYRYRHGSNFQSALAQFLYDYRYGFSNINSISDATEYINRIPNKQKHFRPDLGIAAWEIEESIYIVAFGRFSDEQVRKLLYEVFDNTP